MSITYHYKIKCKAYSGLSIWNGTLNESHGESCVRLINEERTDFIRIFNTGNLLSNRWRRLPYTTTFDVKEYLK